MNDLDAAGSGGWMVLIDGELLSSDRILLLRQVVKGCRKDDEANAHYEGKEWEQHGERDAVGVHVRKLIA